MGLFGILLGLALLVCLAYRGWSILLLAPGAALIAAAFAGGPILAYWTQTFMDSGARYSLSYWPARWSLTAASACLSHSLCSPRWRRPCSAPREFPIA